MVLDELARCRKKFPAKVFVDFYRSAGVQQSVVHTSSAISALSACAHASSAYNY